VADGNAAYATQQVGGKSAEMYETYTALTRAAKMDPATAARLVMQTYSDPDINKQHGADFRNAETIETAVKAMDFNNWSLGGKETSWFGQAMMNGGTVRRKVVNLATTLMRAQGITADQALTHAATRVSQEAVFVNGQVIFGVKGVNPGDGPYIEGILQKVFKDNPDVMKRNGIEDPSGLTVFTDRTGAAVIANAKTLDLVDAYSVTGKHFIPVYPADIRKARDTHTKATEAFHLKKSVANQQLLTNSPFAVHKTLRNWLGIDKPNE